MSFLKTTISLLLCTLHFIHSDCNRDYALHIKTHDSVSCKTQSQINVDFINHCMFDNSSHICSNVSGIYRQSLLTANSSLFINTSWINQTDIGKITHVKLTLDSNSNDMYCFTFFSVLIEGLLYPDSYQLWRDCNFTSLHHVALTGQYSCHWPAKMFIVDGMSDLFLFVKC